MIIEERLGTYEDVVGGAEPAVRAIADHLHDHIVTADPEVYIVPRPGEPSVAYGLGPKKMSQAYCYLMPQKDYLNLGFYHGAAVPDPEGVLEGTGARLRHVKLRSLADAQAPHIAKLIADARTERVAALSG
ncbi:MAG TPA: DUF1801 domain-containing protein [Pseudonocardia sp.]|nr:DUF1801 domain-containing protein [Pseudonocardia sp.]